MMARDGGVGVGDWSSDGVVMVVVVVMMAILCRAWIFFSTNTLFDAEPAVFQR